jgi:hypothetical protein
VSIYFFTEPGGILFETDYAPPFPFGLPANYPGRPSPLRMYCTKYSELDSVTQSYRTKPFSWYYKTCGDGICVPFWVPALAFAVMAVAPCRCSSKRFSLRSMLIATTLIALLLGLVVYATR